MCAPLFAMRFPLDFHINYLIFSKVSKQWHRVAGRDSVWIRYLKLWFPLETPSKNAKEQFIACWKKRFPPGPDIDFLIKDRFTSFFSSGFHCKHKSDEGIDRYSPAGQ
jgi:hypothetical protein